MNSIEATKSKISLLIFLILTIVSLPNAEAPKNIFFLAFLISWFIFSFQNKDWGGSWEFIDTIFALWIILAILVGLNAVLVHAQPFKGSFDLIRYLAFGWIISRVYIENDFLKKIVVITSISILPIFYIFIDKQDLLPENIELNSVGHVNHTAIYLILVLSVTIPYLTENFFNIKKYQKVYFIIFNTLIASIIVYSSSRAASILLVFIFSVSFFMIFLRINLKQRILFLSLLSLFLALVITNPPSVVKKFIYYYSLEEESTRSKINNFSYELFKISPVFGTGMSNFPNFDLSHIREAVVKQHNDNWWQDNKDSFMPYKHPHSIYYALLTGGGIVLLSIFLIFWIYIFVNLTKNLSSKKFNWIDIAVLNISTSILVIGFVNTTFSHENAMLSLLFIGIYINFIRRDSKSILGSD